MMMLLLKVMLGMGNGVVDDAMLIGCWKGRKGCLNVRIDTTVPRRCRSRHDTQRDAVPKKTREAPGDSASGESAERWMEKTIIDAAKEKDDDDDERAEWRS